MEATSSTEGKPKRLYFKTYLQLIRNSIGSEMFRNFYIEQSDGTEADALSDGSDSCAFYVSGVLTLFGKQVGIHGTVDSVLKDLIHSGWIKVATTDIKPGDVILWEKVKIDGDWFEHIGFAIGEDQAVSTSWTEKRVVSHDLHFDGQRKIDAVFRYSDWESGP